MGNGSENVIATWQVPTWSQSQLQEAIEAVITQRMRFTQVPVPRVIEAVITQRMRFTQVPVPRI